jgi:hypothetical protein
VADEKTPALPRSRPKAAFRDQCLAWLDESYRAVAPKRHAARHAARPDAAG